MLRFHASSAPRMIAASRFTEIRTEQIGPCVARVRFDYTVDGVPHMGNTSATGEELGSGAIPLVPDGLLGLP